MTSAAAYALLLAETPGEDPSRDGLAETPERAARAWRELTSGYSEDVQALFKTFEGDGYDELILLSNVPFSSLCEHHLLPFIGVAHIGYIAHGKIIGLSKLARLLEVYARRLQVQERLAMQIADAIEQHLSPLGTMVVIEAEHLCMGCRGVRKSGVTTTTSVMRGLLRDNVEARAEATALIRR